MFTADINWSEEAFINVFILSEKRFTIPLADSRKPFLTDSGRSSDKIDSFKISNEDPKSTVITSLNLSTDLPKVSIALINCSASTFDTSCPFITLSITSDNFSSCLIDSNNSGGTFPS